MEWCRGDYTITDERKQVDFEIVHKLLSQTYWGQRRSRPVVKKLIENSLCFSLHYNDKQIGFGRIVTDFTVFSWLSDLVIADEYQNQGLGSWMLECILAHPSIENTQFVLQTRTGHKLYERYNFERNNLLMLKLPRVLGE